MSQFKKTAVIGTGTMGPGMGAVMARAGSVTTMYDVDPEALGRARDGVATADGVLDRLEMDRSATGSIDFTNDLVEAVDGAELVVEAVPEKLEIKQEVFASVEELVDPEVVFASNTSGIPITDIASELQHPERVVGMHWSNPPHLIPMIEVIPGELTAADVIQRVSEFINSFGYEAVTEHEVPGFVENRILYAILREAVELVERGIISQADMDKCVRWGIGYKLAVIGPMELLDMAGLDIYQSVGSYLNRDLSTASEVSSFVTDLTAQGRLGMKTMGGIYDYTPESIKEKSAERARKLVAVRKALSE